MIFTKVLKQAEKFTIDNSPQILTAIGVVGTITTAYLTHKATVESTCAQIERDAVKRMKGEESLTRAEIVKLTWSNYIPPVASGTLTIAAIVGANHIHTRRMVALAAAYSLADGRFAEYKEKAAEKLGVTKEQKIKDEIAKDRMERNPPGDTIIIGSGEVLCFDQFTGRYFKSDMERLRRAENDMNFEILNSNYASLSDFYERIGLPPTSLSEEVGWKSPTRFELSFSTLLTPDGKPCIAFDLDAKPIREYARCLGE